MSYHDLLNQYGHEQPQAETRVYIFAQAPQKLTTPEEVAYRGRTAAQDIKRLEKLVDDLKDYRRALASRYAELETLPYTYLCLFSGRFFQIVRYPLKLERVPHLKGHIEYVITLTKTLSDGTKTQDLREVFPGKDRRKAFARAAELRRQRPGIPYEEDIARRAWE